MDLDPVRRIARATLPAAIRKPVADAFYRTADLAGSLRARVGLRDTSARSQSPTGESPSAPTPRLAGTARAAPGRLLALPARVHRLGVRLVQVWIVHNLPLLWAREAPTGSARLRLKLLTRLLDGLDNRFERRFRGLLASALPPARRRSGRPLVMAAIGTLGPGGAERQLVTTLVGLKTAYEVDIEVVVMYQDHEWQRFFLPTLEAAGIHVSLAPRDIEERDMSAALSPAAPRLLSAIQRHLPGELGHVAAYARAFLARQPDIVHLWLDEVNVKAGLAAVLAGVGHVVLSMRSVNPSHFVFYQPYMRSAYRVLLERAEVRALNNSHVGAADYAEWLSLPAGRVTVLRNGVDFDRMAAATGPGLSGSAYRAAHAIPEKAFVVGGVMRLSEEKRPLLWLDAAERVALAFPDAHFLLVGDGVQRPLVEARIASSGLADRMHLVGHEQKPYDSMAAMNVLFLSSVFEGCPNVLIEAQALGVPVVSTPAGGAIETLDDGRSGWIVHSGTPREAADVIGSLIRDKDRARRAAAAAPAFVRTRFGMRRMLEETALAYGGLAPRGDEPART